MSRQGVQQIGELFRELTAISEQLSECGIDRAEPAIIPEATLSLIEQMQRLSQEEDNRPVIRTIHHFACTGGTVISKCISSLPNVFLLSEVHPFSPLEIGDGVPVYSPSNLSKLARYASIPNCYEVAEKIFVNSLKDLWTHVDAQGGRLVLRDHTHSDYCVGGESSHHSTLLRILSDDFELRSIATVRDPIDSYASLVTNGWLHFEPKTFDEYCRRYRRFLEGYSQDYIFRYEDFIEDPLRVMEEICEALSLTADDGFLDTFSVFKVTGDSGRGSGELRKRKRRSLEAEFLKEVQSSKQYEIFCQKFGY